jgi:Uma2 family endonuclease
MADPLRKLPEPSSWSDDPFRYGTRWTRVRLPNGELVDQPIPLTPDDLLDPRLGDEVPQSDPHSKIATALYELLKRHFAPLASVTVFFDMKIEWGIPGLPGPSPDITVFRGLPRREGRTIYKAAEEGVLPCLVIEVASFSDAEVYNNDHVKKVDIYQRARVPEYLIIDPPFPPEDRVTLTGYRLAPDGRYRRIKPDSRGRLHSETTGLFFSPSEDGSTVRIGDARTGEWLLTPSEEEAARKAAEERAIREAEARQVAEERAVREAEARKAAEAETARLRAELERLRKGL